MKPNIPDPNISNRGASLDPALALLNHLHELLLTLIVPSLETIQANQARQSANSDALARSLSEFRADMLARFVELHAELAATRAQVEDALATLGIATDSGNRKRQSIH